MGCAKKLPDYLSDDIEKNVFKVSLFDNVVEVETVASSKQQDAGIMAVTPQDGLEEISHIYALNQKRLYPTRFVDGDTKLRPFVDELMLEANGPGERFLISFNLTDNYLVAYVESKGDESNHFMALKSENKIPVFQFQISSYGVLEHRENDLGERTRVLEFRPRHRSRSNHVRIEAKAEARVYAGLRADDFDPSSAILSRENIDGLTLRGDQLTRLMRNHAIMTRTGGVKSDDTLRLKIVGDRLYIQYPTSFDDLSDLERSALNNGDQRIERCSDAQKELFKMENCVLRPIYSLEVEHVNVRRRTDRDSLIATVDFESNIDQERSQLIRINLEQAVKRDQIGMDFSFIDDVLLSKDDIDTDSKFLYVPITLGAPKDIRLVSPFLQGSEKIVKLNWSEKGLEVLEVERDERFQSNELNNHPVLTIPGTHKEFRCRQNDNRECIGGDELDDEITWSERSFFNADLDNLTVLEMNRLDLMTANSPCLIHVSTELVDYEINRDVINVQLEKTYKTNSNFGFCIWEHYFEDPQGLSGLSNASFKAQMHYSIVKLDDLANEQYEAIDYPVADQTRFGFFRSYEKKLGLNYDRSRMEETHLLNRWKGSGDVNNPREIVYYLNDAHFRPENKKYLQVTKVAQTIINDALSQANADIRFRFDFEDQSKKPGDIRHNMIILIDDPLANGPLGYGPTIKDPRTGEIVQGQVNMYSGILDMTTRHNWQSMADYSARKAGVDPYSRFNSVNHSGEASGQSSLEIDSEESGLRLEIDPSHYQRIGIDSEFYQENHLRSLGDLSSVDSHQEIIERNQRIASQRALERLRRSSKSDLSDQRAENENLSDVERLSFLMEERSHELAKNNVFAREFLQVGGTNKTIPAQIESDNRFFKIVNNKRILKQWDELSDDLKREAMNIINPMTYLTIFIHEIGHNLGLRHNFNGSFDKDNFYSKEEVREISSRLIQSWIQEHNCSVNSHLDICHPDFYESMFNIRDEFAYSSIMDYSASRLNELTIFGKYDIAALRFAYGRQVETADGRIVDVEGTLHDQGIPLKQYRFCTDENAGLDPSCNRFEEGTSYTEIAKHYINTYSDYYRYRNFRDGRTSFNEYNLLGYTAARLWEFRRMRNIFESWELFADIFGEDIMIQGCSPEQLRNPGSASICQMINDRRDAVELIGEFYLDILREPDHLCAVAKEDEPNETVDLIRLGELYTDGIRDDNGLGGIQALRWDLDYVPVSCFDVAVEEALSSIGLVVRGESGRFTNGFKDNDPRFPYVSDRYVLGVWVDKVVAMKSLFQRDSELPMTDENHRAMVDIPSIQSQTIRFIEDLVFQNDIREGIPFRNADGEFYREPYKMGLDYIIHSPPRFLYGLKEFFSLPPNGNEYLNKTLFTMPVNFGLTGGVETRDQAVDLVNIFSVKRTGYYSYFNSQDNQDLSSLRIGDTTYRAGIDNPFARIMINSINAFFELSEDYDIELIEDVLTLRTRVPRVPSDLSLNQIEQTVWQNPTSIFWPVANLPPGITAGPDVFVNAFGPNGRFFHQLYNTVGPQRLTLLLNRKEEILRTLPECERLPSDQYYCGGILRERPYSFTQRDEMLELYEFDISLINRFVQGSLNEQSVEEMRENLRLMPDHIMRR